MASKAKRKKKLVTICPRCHSTDVGQDFSNPAWASLGLTHNRNKCNHCGHIGVAFPRGPENIAPKKPKDPDEVKDKTLVDTTYGRGIIPFWKVAGRLAGPLFIALGIMVALMGYWAFFLGISFIIPIGLVLTLFSYKNDFMERRILRALAVLIILYIFLGVYFWGYFVFINL